MTTPQPIRATIQHNHERIKVLNEMRICRKTHQWERHTELQRELERLNIILFGTPAPGIIK